MSYLKDVEQFHRTMGAPILRKPRWPEDKRVHLRHDLIEEEVVKELLPALRKRDMVKTVDALADSLVVILGTALEIGTPMDEVWNVVHERNMSKAIKGHSDDCAIAESGAELETFCTCGAVQYHPNGKIAKPASFIAPDAEIARILMAHGWSGR
jgi:predicted HAD superfamily Cof-like phosphohydrolase